MAFGQIESTAKTFTYNGKAYVGDAVTDYETATIGDITKTFKFIGAPSGDSTAWTGEDLSTEDWVDEAGNVLDSTITQATDGIELELASISKVQIMKWLDARAITHTFTSDENFATNTEVIGSDTIPTQILPFGMINQNKDIAIIWPKTLITGGITFSDKRFKLKLAFKPQSISNDNLKTRMFLYGDAAE